MPLIYQLTRERIAATFILMNTVRSEARRGRHGVMASAVWYFEFPRFSFYFEALRFSGYALL
jgi:hypothetical protein